MGFLDFLKRFRKDNSTHGAGSGIFGGGGSESLLGKLGKENVSARDKAMMESKSFDANLIVPPADNTFDSSGKYVGPRIQHDDTPKQTYREHLADLQPTRGGWVADGGAKNRNY